MTKPDSCTERPVRSLQTMLRTIAQMIPRQLNVIPDGVFGEQTAQAVTCFQQRKGLPATAVVDQQTWELIVEEYMQVLADVEPAQPIRINLDAGQILRRGEENHKLYLVQTMLAVLAQLTEEIPAPEHTGILDADTERSILAFQLKAGLRPTGQVDKTTWKTLALQFSSASDELSRRREHPGKSQIASN